MLPLLVVDTGFSGISSSPSLAGRAAAFRFPFVLLVDALLMEEIVDERGMASSVVEDGRARSDLDVVWRELNLVAVSAEGMMEHV